MKRVLFLAGTAILLALLVRAGLVTAGAQRRVAQVESHPSGAPAPPHQGTPTAIPPTSTSTAGPATATLTPLPIPACGWYRTASVNLGPNGNIFESIAAVAENDIWAVGYQLTTDGPLIEHWNGGQWQLVASPNPGVNSTSLYGVAARTATDAWAVGYDYPCNTCPSDSLLEHWDGSAWSAVPAPHAGTGHNILRHVAILAAGDVWAVGYIISGAAYQTLTLHWDGSAWTIVPSPNAGTDSDILYQVAGMATDDVWAAGYYTPCNGCLSQTLIEHWDGVSWSIVPSPNVAQAHNELTAITMLTATDGWAVGFAVNDPDPERPLILHWDGTAWTIVPSPNSGADGDILGGVAARTANDVWAVGSAANLSTGVERTLSLHWDGSTWTIVSSPSPGTFQSRFSGIAVTQAATWAVGLYRDPSTPYQTLAARYAVACPSPTITPTPVPFTDLDPGHPFYAYIQQLVGRGIVSGYTTTPPCTTGTPCFLPGDNVTRGQTAKFVANAANYQDPIPSGQQTFADVPPSSPFWVYIERDYLHGVISGYTTSPPCLAGVPCFLPGTAVTRGQTAKLVTNAANYQDPIPSSLQTFTDVPLGNPFWLYVERAVLHGAISGYSTSPPCPGTVPCFLPGTNVTRGQTAKFIANAFYPVPRMQPR